MDSQQHIFFICNPLLDISYEAPDTALLDKYQLKLAHATLAEDKDLPLYDELWNKEGTLFIAGGSGLNSARSANFMLKNQGNANKVVYFGSIAHDTKGETLEKCLKEEGVIGNFHYSTEAGTGCCGVIVHNKERCLVANLAAACKYKIEHLHENMDQYRNASLIYATSFFITSNPQALHELAQFASDNSIPFALNFSAVFLLMFELENVLKALRHADFVFCNEDEAAAFGKTQNMEGQSNQEIAKVMAKWEKSNNRMRTAIVTQGPAEVIVAKAIPGSEEVEIKLYPVTKLEHADIVDTNGAGDAFVGGFLSQLWQGKDTDECVRAGIWLSRQVVMRSGCSFPSNFDF